MAWIIDNPAKTAAFVESLASTSVSNAGRNHDLTAGTRQKKGGATGLAATSITAASQHAALEQQRQLQLSFSASPRNQNNGGKTVALPPLNVLAIIDQQRLQVEQHYLDADDDDSADQVRTLEIVRAAPVERHKGKGDAEVNTTTVAPAASADSPSATVHSKTDNPDEHNHSDGDVSPTAAASHRKARSPPGGITSLTWSVKKKEEKPSAIFLTTERPPVDGSGHESIPPVGHYRPKHVLTSEAVKGGYIEPKPRHSPRHSSRKEEPAVVEAAQPSLAQSSEQPGSMTFKSSTTYGSGVGSPLSKQQHAVSARQRAREKINASPSRAPPQNSVFRSLSPKMATTRKLEGADEWYWPRNDPRHPLHGEGTVDFTKSSPRPEAFAKSTSSAPDVFYVAQGRFGEDQLHRTLDVNARTSRDQYPVEKKFFYDQNADIPYDPYQALQAVRPREVGTLPFDKYSPRKPFATPGVDVSVEQCPSPPQDAASQRKRVHAGVPFDAQRGHQDLAYNMMPVMYEVTYDQVQRRLPSAIVDPSSPGHLPLHEPSLTELGPPSSLVLVRPNTIQNVSLGKQSPRKNTLANLHDLEYDTATASPLSMKRVTGNPMMASSLSRERREQTMSLQPKPVEVMYNVPVPPMTKSGANTEFVKQVPREDCFVGKLAPSPSYEVRHPRAPGPGAYNIK